MNDTKDSWTQVGSIVGVYGVKGFVKVFSYTEPPAQILDYAPWQVRQVSNVSTVDLEASRHQDKKIQVRLKGDTDRDQAESWVGASIWVQKDRFPKLEDTEFYWHQLIGLSVINLQGDHFGDVVQIVETGANDVLIVQGTEHSLDREQRLIPYVDGHIVQRIDLEAGEIVVDWQKDYG